MVYGTPSFSFLMSHRFHRFEDLCGRGGLNHIIILGTQIAQMTQILSSDKSALSQRPNRSKNLCKSVKSVGHKN